MNIAEKLGEIDEKHGKLGLRIRAKMDRRWLFMA